MSHYDCAWHLIFIYLGFTKVCENLLQISVTLYPHLSELLFSELTEDIELQCFNSINLKLPSSVSSIYIPVTGTSVFLLIISRSRERFSNKFERPFSLT